MNNTKLNNGDKLANDIKLDNNAQIQKLKKKREILNLNEKNFSKFEEIFLDNFINTIETITNKEIFNKTLELNLGNALYLINKNHVSLYDYANEIY